MLIAVERLLIRLRQPASRADELARLRQRLRAAQDAVASDEERELAHRVLAGKRAISKRLTAVTSCGSCATGLPAPQGSYAGGGCCGGVTPDLFDDHELAALAQTGTRPADLVPPPGHAQHAGCAFRGPRGCTLDVAHRPARCVLYVCDALFRELHRDAITIDTELAELQRDMMAFIEAHQARTDGEVLAPLVTALEDYSRRAR